MSKKSFSKRYNKDEKKVTPTIEKGADELADKDNDGVVVINMAPRNHRDRYANLREDKEEKPVVLDNTDLYISAEEANDAIIDVTEYETMDFKSKIDELDIRVEDVEHKYDTIYLSYETLDDKYKRINSQFEEFGTLDVLWSYLHNIKIEIDAIDDAQSNYTSNLSHTIAKEVYERTESDNLLTKSVESLSENLRSVSEGFDCYRGTHELEHSEIDSKLSSLQGSVDKIDVDSIIKDVDDNRRFGNRVREASKDCIDSLIRVARMLEITFISIVLAFIFLMVKTSIPTSATVVRVIFGVMSDLCMIFIAMESRYVFKYIGFAAKSINKLKEE